MKRITILALPVLIFSGCAYYQPIGISSTSIGSQYERPSGIAEGVSRRWLFFPCYNACPIGEDSLKSAIDDALEGKVGDALANVYAERRTIAFPHIFIPLIVRSDIIVTGTLVKYNTKEFPQDNDAIYSSEPSVLWANLLKLNLAMQKDFIESLSADKRTPLTNYALEQEKAKKIPEASPEASLFYILLKRMRFDALAFTKNASSEYAISDCQTYACILGYSFEEQKTFLTNEKRRTVYARDFNARADAKRTLEAIRKEALKKIRACYPEKELGIVTSPEAKIQIDDQMLLMYLCKEGYLQEGKPAATGGTFPP